MTKNQEKGFDNEETISWQYQPEPLFSALPWGPHRLPIKLAFDDSLSISLEKSGTGYLYRREDQSGSVEKLVQAGKGEIYLCPVEPFHHPARISQYLLLEFDQPILLEPRKSVNFYLTAPLEIAVVFTRKRIDETVLDVFSFLKPKLSLYGTVKNGLVCRYWQSSIHESIPHLNPLAEGILQLTIKNSGSRWADVRQAVFSAQAMKIFYNAQLVAMQATMKINNELTAETTFIDEPLKAGMRKAPEQFSARLLSLPGRMVMEEGY
jgi:uncharacterized protein